MTAKRRTRTHLNQGVAHPCREIIAMLTDYMEGDLPPEDVLLIREHLLACPPCHDFLESLEKTRQAPRSLRVEVSDDCLEALRARLEGQKTRERS